LPDLTGCPAACGAAARPIDNQTAIASRALVEAITDPGVGLATTFDRPIAWYDTGCGEIGAICDGRQGTINVGGTTWTVHQLWSNAAGDCVVTRSATDGGSPQGACGSGDGGADARGGDGGGQLDGGGGRDGPGSGGGAESGGCGCRTGGGGTGGAPLAVLGLLAVFVRRRRQRQQS
jgi:MYXO-CTERM domain-containing protein